MRMMMMSVCVCGDEAEDDQEMEKELCLEPTTKKTWDIRRDYFFRRKGNILEKFGGDGD